MDAGVAQQRAGKWAAQGLLSTSDRRVLVEQWETGSTASAGLATYTHRMGFMLG
jgi:hypothetical protein